MGTAQGRQVLGGAVNLHFPPELKEILMQGDARPRSEKPQGEDWLSEPAFPRASLRNQHLRRATSSKHVRLLCWVLVRGGEGHAL